VIGVVVELRVDRDGISHHRFRQRDATVIGPDARGAGARGDAQGEAARRDRRRFVAREMS
jgi:hypothetical protein